MGDTSKEKAALYLGKGFELTNLAPDRGSRAQAKAPPLAIESSASSSSAAAQKRPAEAIAPQKKQKSGEEPDSTD